MAMDPLFRIPIRLQLIIIVAIVALPAACIILYSGVQQRTLAIDEACMNTQRLVDRIASEQRILISSVKQLAVSLSEMSEVKKKDVAKVNLLLSKLFKLHSNLTIIFIADSSGTIWGTARTFESPITVNDRRYFKNAMTSGQLSSGEFQIGRITHEPSFLFGFPYKNDQGVIIGTVCVGIALKEYKLLLERTQLPQKANVVFIDHKGLILFSATDYEKNIGKPFDPVLFKDMLIGPDEGTSFAVKAATGSPTQDRYVSYQKLRLEGEQTPYMYVRVGIPVESIVSKANEQMAGNLLLFSIVLATSLFFAWLVGKRSIADRIDLLEKASRNLANGDLQIRVADLIKGGELGRLGESFDVMAGQIAAREESLSNNQRFLNSIIDTEPECLKMLDSEGRILMMNPAGLEMIGVKSLDQIKSQSIFPRITAEYRDEFVKLTQDVFEGLPGNMEFEADCFNGRHVWLDTHVVPFRNDHGEITSLLGITRDITARKIAEESLSEKQRQLEELNKYLEQRVAKAVLALRDKDQIMIQQGRQAAMGEMIGNIAHQWRQPLNILGLIVQELKIKFCTDELSKEDFEASVSKAMGVIVTMSQTIDGFGNYFKPDKEKRIFNVNQIIAKTIYLVEPSFSDLNIDIKVILVGDIEIDGFPNEYSQVLLNIILNCRDAFEGRNAEGQRTITVTVFKDEDKSVVTVTDNAGGIPADIIDKIFDPYFTTKGPDKGTGIGLYMSKAIIEKNMGGRLTVRNTLDGAEFRIEI